jgi:hypothetical protein
MAMTLCRWALVASLALVPLGGRCGDKAAEGSRSQRFTTNFTARCKAGTAAVMAARMGWPADKLTPYALPETTFNVRVPGGYDGTSAYGLFVYVSPTPSGELPRALLKGLQAHRLIYVGADNSGNGQRAHKRIGLALDGAFNMVKGYRVDRERVYIGGVSGGGRISSMTALAYPDIFKGCLAIVGVNFYRALPVPDMPGKSYPAVMRPPAAPMLARARGRSRFVLVTGSRDANRDNTWTVYRDGFVKDGFRHVFYREIEGMGHVIPGADALQDALRLLGAPSGAVGSATPNP